MGKVTYLIRKSVVQKALNMAECICCVENVFTLYGRGETQMPAKVYLSFEEGDLRCMPAFIPSMKAAGVKNVNVHPANRDLPAVMATITLIDPEDGFPLALMDGTYITAMRTGAAGAVGAKYLSREDSKVAAFIGTGVQARTQLEALLVVRHKIVGITAYDVDKKAMEDFAREAAVKYGLKALCAGSVNEATADADVVVTATPARKPIVMNGDIRDGAHINAVGADAAGKQELDPVLLKRARVVIDNWEQSSHGGEINGPFSKGVITRKDIYADIGEIVTGKKRARTSADQVTVFDSTGLAIQDIAVAHSILARVMSGRKLRDQVREVDLLGLAGGPASDSF